MRTLALLLLLASPAAAQGRGMVAVADDERMCRLEGASICYEWQLTSDPALRFVAYGNEDGIDYSFYRRSSTEAYRHIVRVFPVLLDSSRADSLFWGYPWDIEDLVPDEASDMLATFEHDLIYDGVDYPRPWQRRMPAVLFAGRTTQPQLTVSALPFEPAALSALRRRALD